jgi:hypothetical protein
LITLVLLEQIVSAWPAQTPTLEQLSQPEGERFVSVIERALGLLGVEREREQIKQALVESSLAAARLRRRMLRPFRACEQEARVERRSAEHVAAASLCIGWSTRSSALVLLLASSQLAQLSPGSDRGIDTLLRNVLIILVFAPSGATLSADARLRTGRWISDACVVAWPRYLIVAQLVVMYFSAGIQKQSQAWTSLGGYSALYLVLHQPHYAAFSLPHEWLVTLSPFLRISTFVSVWFERLSIFVPWLMWRHATRERPGRVRSLVNRAHILGCWVTLGITFHLGLALGLELGIFPWGCIALYPAFFPPESIRGAWTRLSASTGRWRGSQTAAPASRWRSD